MKLPDLADKLFSQFKEEAKELRQKRLGLVENLDGIEKIAKSLDYSEVIDSLRNIPSIDINQNTINHYIDWYRSLKPVLVTFITKMQKRQNLSTYRNEFGIPISTVRDIKDIFGNQLEALPYASLPMSPTQEYLMKESEIDGSLEKIALAMKEVSFADNTALFKANKEIEKVLVPLRSKQFREYVEQTVSDFETKTKQEQLQLFMDFEEQFVQNNIEILKQYFDILSKKVQISRRRDNIAIKKHILNLSVPETHRYNIMNARIFENEIETTSDVEHYINSLTSVESRNSLKRIIEELSKVPRDIRKQTAFLGSIIIHHDNPAGAMNNYYPEKTTHSTIKNNYTRLAFKFYELIHPTFLPTRGKHYVKIDFESLENLAQGVYLTAKKIVERKKELKDAEFTFKDVSVDYPWEVKLYQEIMGRSFIEGDKNDALFSLYEGTLLTAKRLCDLIDKTHEVRFISDYKYKPTDSYANFKSIVNLLMNSYEDHKRNRK